MKKKNVLGQNVKAVENPIKYKYLSIINEKKPFIKIYLLFFNFCISIINKLLLITNHDNRVN